MPRPPTANPPTTIVLRLQGPLLELIDSAAKAESTSRNVYITRLLANHFAIQKPILSIVARDATI
jgi:hypothetical protein